MHDPHRTATGLPIVDLGWTDTDRALLTVARHYFAAFAAPGPESWPVAIAAALASFGERQGPGIAVAVLATIQTMRRLRRSVFRFNRADCPRCADFATGHERLLIGALRAASAGRRDAALALVTLLCEGEDATRLVDVLDSLARETDAGAVPAGTR
jgi:hypothetical protein